MARYDFLQVDRFLTTELAAAALQMALRMGIIDRLNSGSVSGESLAIDPKGRALLLDMLSSNGVIVVESGDVHLSDTFRAILPFRDLLEAKLDFAAKVAADMHFHFAELVTDLPAFMAKSKTFELFRYDRCFSVTPENVAATREWVRLTTALTRYESQAFLALADLAGVSRLMDIGGNSGEFALRLCRAHPALTATVFDLPVVAAIGREHVGREPEAKRIAFVEGDMRRDVLPGGQDWVSFKSLLHDWPDTDAVQLIARAREAIRPGGTLAIFERGLLKVPPGGLPYSMLPNLVFFRFFRPAEFYVDAMRSAGFHDVKVQTVALEMDFNLITGVKAP